MMPQHSKWGRDATQKVSTLVFGVVVPPTGKNYCTFHLLLCFSLKLSPCFIGLLCFPRSYFLQNKDLMHKYNYLKNFNLKIVTLLWCYQQAKFRTVNYFVTLLHVTNLLHWGFLHITQKLGKKMSNDANIF